MNATDIIKKAREDLGSHAASGRVSQGGSGLSSARRTTTEPLQILCQAELEDMCQDDDDWQWQEHWVDDWKTSEGPGGAVCDSTTSQALDMRRVKVGRQEELEWMQKMHVWDRVP